MMSDGGRRVLEVLGQSAGGIARHVALVTEGLDGRNGLTVDIAAPENLPVALPKAVKPLSIPNGPFGGHRAARARIRELVERGNYDVVHAHGLRAGIDSGLALKGTDIPVYLTVHNLVLADISGRLKALFLRRAEPLAVRLSSRTFAASQQITDHLREVAPKFADRVETLHAPVGDAPLVNRSRSEVRSELDLSEDDRLLVTVARLAPQKALEVMLAAIARLPENVVLAVIGEGPLESELKIRAADLGVDKRVRWTGFRSDIGDFMAAADVFVLTSVWEAVALVIQEAVLLETPVVSTDVGGIGELITDGKSGRLVPKGDEVAFAAAVAELLESDELRTKFAANALADLQERFSKEKMLSRLEEVYRG